jgi:hypothetical protein
VCPVTTPHQAAERFYCAQLFLAVLLGMSLYCLFSMPSSMSGIVVLGDLLVVTGGMLKMF